ncbi:hypothetical protein TCAL_03203 [Tigriopus californicus]|uniref:Uncharacterized protein n=1 Tax=Tigriopus californicus TaxID=6832 RepID=A0A553N721_TIGCA|nr:hypothetical protein TCAL_03203 [Tigriopus californicus]
MSFCRITGKARNLPKPNFFPIIPPVCPGDARVMCRITTKRMDYHNYVPLIEAGKRPESVKNQLSQNKENLNVNLSSKSSDGISKSDGNSSKNTLGVHEDRPDFKYVEPVLKSDAVDKCDLKAFEDLQRILKRYKKGLNSEDAHKKFVYLMPSMLCGLVVPAAVEEAIRHGDLESVSVAKGCDKAIFKMKGKPTLFVSLREIDMENRPGQGSSNNGLDYEGKVFFDGRGQSKDTLSKQRQAIESKKRKTLANKKIFEDLERQADEQMQRDLEISAARDGGGKAETQRKRIREAKKYRKALQEFKDKNLPQGNMTHYEDWETALKTNIHQLNWKKMDSIPEPILSTMQIPKAATKFQSFNEASLRQKKRERNVFIPDQPGLELVPMTEQLEPMDPKVSPELFNFIAASKKQDCPVNSSVKSMFANSEETLKMLPTLAEFALIGNLLRQGKQSHRKCCLYDHGDGAKYAPDPSHAPSGSNVIVGAIVEIEPDQFKFIPGEEVKQENGQMSLVPGQKMAAAGGEFIPGLCIRGDEPGQFKFIPGTFSNNKKDRFQFVAGQFISRSDGTGDFVQGDFVQGQIVHTPKGAKFVEGQTINTVDGLKFVACSMVETETGPQLVPGTVIDVGPEQCQFVPGQMVGGTTLDDCIFIPGQSAEIDGQRSFLPGQVINGEFVPGQMMRLDGNQAVFVPGQTVISEEGRNEFVCGIFEEGGKFTPGMTLDSLDGPVFVMGRLCSQEGKTMFVPGKITNSGDPIASAKGQARFEKAKDVSDIVMKSSSPTESSSLVVDGNSLSLAFKKMRPQKGAMVQTKRGPQFIPEDGELPEDRLPGKNSITTGRLECGEEGQVFIPGKSMQLNGIKTFIPGKMVPNEDGTETFVPGKVIQTKNGPKFVSGQVIQTEDGEKFLPGIVMDSPNGKIFVPAMEIQTKSGHLLIPGQVIVTDNGLKFVPGDIVSTEKGALFVPGLVIDSPDGAKFIHGEVIETPDGPRVLPPDVRGDGNMDYCVQGFDINMEEVRLLLGKSNSSGDVTDLLGGVGGAVVSPEALKALAEGFECVKSNVIPTMGAQGDVDKLLNDELLDAYDSPAVRKIINGVFTAVFTELCAKVEEVEQATLTYTNGPLKANMKSTLMSQMKLNPALDKLKSIFEKKNVSESEENEILNLIAGIITCSIPGALKECCSDKSKDDLEEEEFKEALLDCIEESIQSILGEDGVISNGIFEDIQELVKLAKDLEFDENQSFFSKVAAVTEGRCNSKFVNKLMTQLEGPGGVSNIDTKEIANKLVNVLGSKVELQDAFKEMSEKNPDFIKEVLEQLSHEGRHSTNENTVELLQNAIVKAVEDNCQKQLDVLIDQLQEAGETGALTDEDVRSMLKQAIGLAKYMKRPQVVDQLTELLHDPVMINAIKDDGMTRDILRKLLVLRKLAGRDKKKRHKLQQLENYNSDSAREDDSLKEFVNQSKILTTSTGMSGKLKKSKSMIKKSKSMIMTAKDIPMTAFMAMKSNTDEKDEKWLQNFLSESVMEDIPWECSKALIILKEGLQAIIPREASRSILLGDASYTLIDDNGVEFFLSPSDKQRRENGDASPESAEPKLKTMRDLLQSDPDYKGKFSKLGSNYVDSKIKGPTMDSIPFKGSLSSSTKLNGETSFGSKLRSSKSPSPLDDIRKPPKPSVNFRIATDAEIMDSLEKYRPKNHRLPNVPNLEAGPPVADCSNINDLRDYYAGLGTHQRAMKRLSLLNGGHSRIQDEDEPEHFETFKPQMPSRRFSVDSYSNPGPRSFSVRPNEPHFQRGLDRNDHNNWEEEDTFPGRPGPNGANLGRNMDNYRPERDEFMDQIGPSYPRRPSAMRQLSRESDETPAMSAYDMSGLDDSTKKILDRARSIRSKPIWEGEADNGGRRNKYDESTGHTKKMYNWDDDTFEYVPEEKAAPAPQDDTMLSSKTRTMLDKLKESTMALQGLNEQSTDDPYARPFGQGVEAPQSRAKRPSRFLRSNSAMDGPREPARAPSIEPIRSRFAASPSPPNHRPYGAAMGLADNILSIRSDNGRRSSRAPDDDPYNGYTRNTKRGEPSYSQSSRGRSSQFGRDTASPENDNYPRFTSSRDYNHRPRRESPELPTKSGNKFSSSRGRRGEDDEDFDSMIANLKKKTSGRDMLQRVSQIEGRDVTPPRQAGGGSKYGRQTSGYGDDSDSNDDNTRFQQRPAPGRARYSKGPSYSSRNDFSDDESDFPTRPKPTSRFARRPPPPRDFDNEDDD